MTSHDDYTLSTSFESPDTILPIIKRNLKNEKNDVPSLTLLSGDEPIIDHFVGNLLICYVFDFPSHFNYVSRNSCDRLRISQADLRSLSVANLCTRRQKPEVKSYEFGAAFFLDGDLEASILLARHVWDQVEPQVPGELIAAVPKRNTLMVTGTGVEGGAAALKRSIDKFWRTADPRLLLTRSLLVRRNRAWRVL